MTTYILKFMVSSGLLWLVYYGLLENQKMHIFNRFYLLFALVFSGIIPFVSIDIPIITDSQIPVLVATETANDVLPTLALSNNETPVLGIGYYIVWGLYLVVTAVVLVRFLSNIFKIMKQIKQNKYLKVNDLRLVLLHNNIRSHSFLSYIFLSQNDYQNGHIEKEVLHHEQAHVRQRHTLDVIFIELLLIFFWFNPLLFLYRKAIALNHEFLADSSVIDTFQNTTNYQYLLLNKIAQSHSILFTSQFNYLITKKRLIMMTKTTSPTRRYATQIAASVSFVVLLFVCGDISFAQKTTEVQTQSETLTDDTFSEKGVSQALIDEYEALAAKHVTVKKNKKGERCLFVKSPSDADRHRLVYIFTSMTKAQQNEQVYTMRFIRPRAKTTPTQTQFESYKNPKIYGVWIDDKKVTNATLNKYEASDFSDVFISKLYRNAQATIGYKYKFQLDLQTHAHYKKTQAENSGAKQYYLMVGSKYFKNLSQQNKKLRNG